MKQQANKSFFGLKWLAVLIATLLLVGTFARVSTVNAETQQPVDTTKMKIQGAFERKINFVDGEDFMGVYGVVPAGDGARVFADRNDCGRQNCFG